MTCTKKLSTLIIFLLMPVWVNAAEFHVSKSWELFLALKTAAENDTDDSIFLAEGTYSGAFSYNIITLDSLSIQAEDDLSAEKVVVDNLTIDMNDFEPKSKKGDFILKNVTFKRSSIKTYGSTFLNIYNNITVKGCHFIKSYMFLLSESTTNFVGNVFTDQTINWLNHYLAGFKFVTVKNNIFYKNSGLNLRIIGQNIKILNNVFFNNDYPYEPIHLTCLGYAITESGAGIEKDTDINVHNNTISHYTYDNIRDLIYEYRGHLISSNNIIHGDDNPYHNDDNLLYKTHFIDPENGDFHLKPTSSYIDAGSNKNIAYTETDIDGNPRIANGIVDMGAYEFTTNRTHPADTNQNWVIESDEFSAYNNAWKNAENWPIEPAVIPSEYLTRCGFLLKKGGRYKDVGLNRPLCWMPDN